MSHSEQKIASPCISLCGYNDDKICTGCFRSQEEIVHWPDANNEERLNILNNGKQRKAELA